MQNVLLLIRVLHGPIDQFRTFALIGFSIPRGGANELRLLDPEVPHPPLEQFLGARLHAPPEQAVVQVRRRWPHEKTPVTPLTASSDLSKRRRERFSLVPHKTIAEIEGIDECRQPATMPRDALAERMHFVRSAHTFFYGAHSSRDCNMDIV